MHGYKRTGELAEARKHFAAVVEDGEELQLVLVGELKVGRVVRRRDLHRARAERAVDALVADDRQQVGLAVAREWVTHLFACTNEQWVINFPTVSVCICVSRAVLCNILPLTLTC